MRATTHWTPERDKTLLDLKSNNLDHETIGRRLGVTAKAIGMRLVMLRKAQKAAEETQKHD